MKYSWMMMMVLAIVFSGCSKPAVKKYDRQLPEGQLALRKITDPAELPDMLPGLRNLANLDQAIGRSLEYMSKPSSQNYFPYGQITHKKAVMSLDRFRELIKSAQSPEQLQSTILREFDVYVSVGCDDLGTVLFTGYYTPIFQGSRQQTSEYKYPLYSLPEDLVKGAEGMILGRRMPDGSLKRYPARAEIERSRMLAGKEIIWLKDKFDAYVAHVQGSAKIRLPSREVVTLGYAGNNGYDYRSINAELVKDGKIPASEINLSRMIEFFRANPMLLDEYVFRNERFVFFREQQMEPLGSLNVEVTPMRTVATDKAVYPRGSVVFVDTTLPRQKGMEIAYQPFGSFMLDQDTGGAIRAPGRCDIYMGVGDNAGKMAGYTHQEGKLYYLFLK